MWEQTGYFYTCCISRLRKPDFPAGWIYWNWTLSCLNDRSICSKTDPFHGTIKLPEASIPHFAATHFKVSYHSMLNHRDHSSFQWRCPTANCFYFKPYFIVIHIFQSSDHFLTLLCTSLLIACLALNLLLPNLIPFTYLSIFKWIFFRRISNTLTKEISKEDFAKRSPRHKSY